MVPALADPASVTPTKDALLNEAAPTTNDGAGTTLSLGAASGSLKSGVFHYDLSSHVGRRIVGIEWIVSTIATGGAEAYTIERLTRAAWVEAQTTWTIYSLGNNWTTPGGDVATDDAVPLTSPTATGVANVLDDEATIALMDQVQTALDADGHVHFRVQKANDDTHTWRISSREGATAPVLVVSFEAPGILARGRMFRHRPHRQVRR
jgi:hypothetical protein